MYRSHGPPAFLILVLFALAESAASSDVARVCDLDHDALFGVITDVGIDERGSLYALDEQLFTVHVMDSPTQELHAIGTKGEGPGEFWAPRSMAVSSDGRVTVFQGFHAPAVAFDPGHEPVSAPRLERIRSGWASTEFVRADVLDDGTYVVAMMRLKADVDAESGGARSHRELVHFDSSGNVLATILSTDGEADPAIVAEPAAMTALYDSWDVSDDGTIVFVDGDRPGSVTTFSLIDRVARQYELVIGDDVRAATAELVRVHGLETGTLPHIASVTWSEPGKSVVVQTLVAEYAEAPGITREDFTVHDLQTGVSEAIVVRHAATEHDLVVLRDGHVVVVEGAVTARKELIANWKRALRPDSEPDVTMPVRPGTEKTCIRIYDLRGS